MAHYDGKSRKAKISEALQLWEIWSETYRTNIPRYRDLLARRRELKITPLNVVKESLIKDYPVIPFLQKETREEAEEYLEILSYWGICNVIVHVKDVVNFNNSFCTLTNRVKEFSVQDRNYGKKCSIYSMSPDSRR